MKTIEEIAKEYAEKAWAAIPIGDFDEDHVTFDNIVTEAYIAGAKSEHAELTRWHDPKEEMPEPYKSVLVKAANMCYGVGFYEPQSACFADIGYLGATIIGWRDIHE